MTERRKYKRLDISVPLSVRLLKTPAPFPPINVETGNISLDGLLIVIKIKIRAKHRLPPIQEVEDSIKLLSSLLLRDNALDLGINILPKGGTIKGTGKVMWYDRYLSEGFYHLRAGIFLEQMESAYKEKWHEFVKTVYPILFYLEK